MGRFLSKRGAEIREAGDGQAALERLQEGFEPHVILADLRMPRMDGAEFFERLQQERPALADRLLFLSGDITHLASRGLAEVPRDRVFVKPVELAELERRIAAFVREKAAMRRSSSASSTGFTNTRSRGTSARPRLARCVMSPERNSRRSARAGRSCCRRSKNSAPSIRGMRRSARITCGSNPSCKRSNAAWPSPASRISAPRLD